MISCSYYQSPYRHSRRRRTVHHNKIMKNNTILRCKRTPWHSVKDSSFKKHSQSMHIRTYPCESPHETRHCYRHSNEAQNPYMPIPQYQKSFIINPSSDNTISTQRHNTKIMKQSKLFISAIALLATFAIFACTNDSSSDTASQQDLTNAQATATAAMNQLNAAMAERDAAMDRAEQSEQMAANMQAETAMTTGGERLANAIQRDNIVCATANDTPGFHALDASGENIGFDVDLCRAVAAAVFGDPDKVEYRYITLNERGPTLQSGEVDLMNLTTTWTSTRDANWGNFAPIMFYDGQGFMAQKSLNIQSALELDGAAVCVTTGTTTELNLADYFRQNNLNYTPTIFDQTDVAFDAYKAGQCDAFTTDRSGLASLLSELTNPEDHVILPEIISEEPLTPVVPHGDDQWFDIVKAVMAGLIYAEAYGINSGNVDQIAQSDDVKAKRLLGVEGGFGQDTLGLEDTFMQDVIKTVGNYSEIYERNLGEQGIGLPRQGRNDLWLNGGQIYAAPLR